jgi:hypothetical protein
MSKVSRTGIRAEGAFALSENVITFHNVDPDERLESEVVEIYPLGDAEIDCTVETDAKWISAEVRDERIVINLHPREGSNRGKIMVRDRHSGTAQALRVEAYVNRRSQSTPAPAGSPAKGAATASDAALATSEEIPAQQPAWPPHQGRAPVPPPSQPPTLQAHDQQTTWPAQQHQPPNEPPPRPEPAEQSPRPQGRYSPQVQAGQPDWPPPQSGQARGPQQANNSKARTALITAVVAFVLSWVLVGGLIAPFALVLASQASKLQPPAGSPSSSGFVIAARILGWAAIAVCALAILGRIIG